MNFIKCEKLEKSMAELQFSIDAEAFKGAVADVFKKEGKKYSVPGFRKGKAPRSLIEKMYGADVFTYDAINELFPAAYEAAVKEAGIEPVGRPEVSVDAASETEGVTLTVKVAVMPEVKVGNYNGLTVEKTVHTVTDEAVDAELKRVQERMLDGDVTALTIFQKIGLYLGYTVPWYREFYGFDSMMILGRVTSGPGGVMILETARLILADQFPEIADQVEVFMPDEKARRVGQSVAAATLPML